MVRVAICDDTAEDLRQVAWLTEHYFLERELPAEVVRFQRGEDLLDSLAQGDPFDLYLLDILMPRHTGIDLARALRQESREAAIVFLTSSKDYALDAFGVGAIQYLVKPCQQEALYAALDQAAGALENLRRRFLTLHTEGGVVRLAFQDIIYCETRKNYQYLYTEDGVLKVRLTSAGLYELLAHRPEFVKIGASFILNLDHVREVTVRVAKLSGQMEIPLPRGAHQELRNRFLDYYRGG